MSEWSKENLRDMVLRQIGVLGSGQTATGEDASIVSDAIDTVHSTLRKKGRAPFPVDEIPDWAQLSLRDYVAWKVADLFGVAGELRARVDAAGPMALQDLQEQVAMSQHNLPIVKRWF